MCTTIWVYRNKDNYGFYCETFMYQNKEHISVTPYPDDRMYTFSCKKYALQHARKLKLKFPKCEFKIIEVYNNEI